MRDQPNHRLLAEARFLRATKTPPTFRLYDLGRFPGLVANGDQPIVGEVYELETSMLEMLDRFEGSLYRRATVVLEDGTTAYVYVLLDGAPSDCPVVDSANWRTHRERRVR